MYNPRIFENQSRVFVDSYRRLNGPTHEGLLGAEEEGEFLYFWPRIFRMSAINRSEARDGFPCSRYGGRTGWDGSGNCSTGSQLFGHLGPGCRLVVFLEGNRQNRPAFINLQGEHYVPDIDGCC